MSALGQKRTFAVQSSCPLYPISGHLRLIFECPLRARRGISVHPVSRLPSVAMLSTLRAMHVG